MSKNIIIGVCGDAGSGKDQFADFILQVVNGRKYSYAKPMKEALKIVFDWTDEHMYGSLKEVVDPVYGVSPREAMQKLGTEWRDTINKNLWTIRAEKELTKDVSRHGIVVVPDVRFDHEAEQIKRLGGVIVKVSRPDNPKKVRAHISEQGVSSKYLSYFLLNDGSLEDYKNDSLSLAKEILERLGYLGV